MGYGRILLECESIRNIPTDLTVHLSYVKLYWLCIQSEIVYYTDTCTYVGIFIDHLFVTERLGVLLCLFFLSCGYLLYISV